MANAYGSCPSGSEGETRTGTRSQSTSQFGGERSSSTSSSSSPHSERGAQVKEKARQVARSAKDTAGRAMHEARERASSALDQQLEAARSRLDSVADAIEHTATELDDDPMVADLAHRAADGVHRFSGYLREHDLRDIVDEVEEFARRHPVWFLGGMFVAGMLAARLLKSGTEHDGEMGAGEFHGGEFERGIGYEGEYSAAAGMSAMSSEGGRWEAP